MALWLDAEILILSPAWFLEFGVAHMWPIQFHLVAFPTLLWRNCLSDSEAKKAALLLGIRGEGCQEHSGEHSFLKSPADSS